MVGTESCQAKILISVVLIAISFNPVENLRFEKHPDSGLHIGEILSKYGYPVEDHFVTTEDGYILHLHRVPHGRNAARNNRKPVLLMHGLLGSAENYVISGPQRALVYQLAENGYDVWMGNARGSMHSRNHTTLDPDNHKKFWLFSWHEIGFYDLAAKIDHILNVTKKNKLQYIGHSQGGTTLLVLLSERPQYNKKIQLATLLAPNVLNRHPINPLYVLLPYRKYIERFLEAVHMYELFPFNSVLLEIFKSFCEEVTIGRPICLNIFMTIGGFNPSEFDPKMASLIASTAPAGSSTRQLYHYMQIISSREFKQYDYGKRLNLIKYKRPTPPLYHIRNVTIPVEIFYGGNDLFIPTKDIEDLGATLQNVRVHLVKDKYFTHLDFVFAKHTVPLLYRPMLELMEKHEKS